MHREQSCQRSGDLAYLLRRQRMPLPGKDDRKRLDIPLLGKVR